MSTGPEFLLPPPPEPPGAASQVEAAPPSIRWGMGDVIIGLLLWLAGGLIASIIVILVWSPDGRNALDGTEALGVGAVAVSMIAGWPGFLGWPFMSSWFKGQRSLTKDFGLAIRPIDLGWGVLGGVIALSLSVLAGIVWRLISNAPEPTNADFIPSRPAAGTALLLFVLVALCTPIVEELFFRGLMLRSVGRRLGLPAGVIISSMVFGLLHFQGSGLPGLFIAGVTSVYGAVFALLVVRAGGRLGPSIIGHMVVNAVGVLSALYLA